MGRFKAAGPGALIMCRTPTSHSKCCRQPGSGWLNSGARMASRASRWRDVRNWPLQTWAQLSADRIVVYLARAAGQLCRRSWSTDFRWRYRPGQAASFARPVGRNRPSRIPIAPAHGTHSRVAHHLPRPASGCCCNTGRYNAVEPQRHDHSWFSESTQPHTRPQSITASIPSRRRAHANWHPAAWQLGSAVVCGL